MEVVSLTPSLTHSVSSRVQLPFHENNEPSYEAAAIPMVLMVLKRRRGDTVKKCREGVESNQC